MPSPAPCVPACCNTPQVVNVPGVEGLPGTECTPCADGVDAWTSLTVDFTVLAGPATSTISVANSTWMVIGEIIVIGEGTTAVTQPGVGHFEVISLPSDTAVEVLFRAFVNDVAPGVLFVTGAIISPSGDVPSITLLPVEAVYGAGTAYTLTTTPALVNFGTTPVSLTMGQTTTYLLSGQVKVDYSATTFSANRTVSVKLRRTNNTPTDVSDALVTYTTQIVTTVNGTLAILTLPEVAYVATAGDILQMFISVDTLPDAGSVKAITGNITALPLF